MLSLSLRLFLVTCFLSSLSCCRGFCCGPIHDRARGLQIAAKQSRGGQRRCMPALLARALAICSSRAVCGRRRRQRASGRSVFDGNSSSRTRSSSRGADRAAAEASRSPRLPVASGREERRASRPKSDRVESTTQAGLSCLRPVHAQIWPRPRISATHDGRSNTTASTNRTGQATGIRLSSGCSSHSILVRFATCHRACSLRISKPISPLLLLLSRACTIGQHTGTPDVRPSQCDADD